MKRTILFASFFTLVTVSSASALEIALFKPFLNLKTSLLATQQSVESQDPSSHATTVWMGFNHQWEKDPHRLSKLGSFVSKNELNDKKIVSQQNSVFRVGAFEDHGYVDMKAKFVKSPKLKFYHSSIGYECLSVTGNMKQLKSKTCTKTFDLDEIGMGNMDHVEVILSGFNVKADSYERGYNTMGFGVLVGMEDDVVSATFKIKPEHEPVRPSVDDKCDQDNHCTTYTYSARIYFTLIGYNDDDAAITHGYNTYNEFVRMSPNMANRDHAAPYPSYEKRHDSIVGEEDFARAFVAMRGFEFMLGEWDATKKDGRYIREIEFNVDDVKYNKNSGQADFTTNMYFSNDGAWPYGFDATYKMWTSLIQFGDTSCEITDDEWHTGELGEGEIQFKQSLEHNFSF